MKVLLHDDTQAYLCHGGKQVLAANLLQALRKLDIDVEYSRWWDPDQRCDVIHTFGCTQPMAMAVKQAGVRLVLTHIVDEMTNSSRSRRNWHRARNLGLRKLTPDSVQSRFSWKALSFVDQFVYLHQADARTGIDIYGVPATQTQVIPHGCDAEKLECLQSGPRSSSTYLVSIGSIVPRKNAVVLARAAKRARVPTVFLGRPFNQEDPYFKEFESLVDDKWVVYPGFVSEGEKNQWLIGASGFVLASRAESGCIAVYEAAAAGLPMLLSNLPWARTYDAGSIHFVEPIENELSSGLKPFFDHSSRLGGLTFPIATWDEIANRYLSVYSSPNSMGDWARGTHATKDTNPVGA